MIDKEGVDAQVRQILTQEIGCDADDVKDEARLDALGADSLDCVEITMAVEEAFAIRISDDEATAAETVGAWIALVESKRP